MRGRPEDSLHERLESRPLFQSPILIHLAIFIRKRAFRDYNTMKKLFNIIPSEEEI